jgi:hypothetical protein
MSESNDDAQAAEPAKPAQRTLSPTPQPARGSTRGGDEPSNSALNHGQILRKLDLLPGLVATGVLTPQKSNSMRAVYQTMLSHLDNAQRSASAEIPNESVLKTLREAPELLALFRPFLTPQQVALIVENAPLD